MVELSVEHLLLFVVTSFLLYHLMGSCGCSGNGFRVGGLSRAPIEYPEDWNKSCILNEVQKQSCNFENSIEPIKYCINDTVDVDGAIIPYTGRSICSGANNYIDCIMSSNSKHHFKWCKNINKCSDAFNKEFLEKKCGNVNNESDCQMCAGKNQELREYCKEGEIQNICKNLFT
jgi:hypothetical protein